MMDADLESKETIARLRKQLAIAMEALKDFGSPLCDNLHHEKADRHEYDEPCPIVSRIRIALEQIKALG